MTNMPLTYNMKGIENMVLKLLQKGSFLLLGGICIVVIPSIFGILENNVAMGLAIVAGSILVALANMDKISEVSGAGFSLKMRELQKTIEKANATTEQLSVLGTGLARAVLDAVRISGQWGGASPEQMMNARKTIIESLTQLDVGKKKIHEVTASIDERILQSLGSQVGDAVISCTKNNAIADEVRKLAWDNPGDVNGIISILHNHSITDDKVDEKIKKLEQFLQEKTKP